MMRDSILFFQEVSKAYGSVRALEGVSLTLAGVSFTMPSLSGITVN
jgi:ABC-type sugar transport system ATPase subunit